MEAQTGVSLFPWIVQQAGATFNLDALWTQIRAIPHPGPAPSISIPPPKPSDTAAKLKGWSTHRKLIAACVAAVPFALLWTGAEIPLFWILVASVAAFTAAYRFGDRSQELSEIRRKRDAVTADWNRIQGAWQSQAGSQSFDEKRSELERLKQQLDQLPAVRLQKLNELTAQHPQLQLEEFLDGFELDSATIPSIGPSRKQTLSSYGIETAADITESRVTGVPGFGPVYRARLMEWRASITARFRFDPTRRIDPQHAAKIEQDILSERRKIEDKLRTGCVQLRTTHNQIVAARKHIRTEVEAAYAGYLQATADFDAAKE
jgi:DNA-binding helix-hairpin-helix protein with protein kinase domain